MAKKKKQKFDPDVEVTNAIIEALSAGTNPWQRPWDGGQILSGLPFNPTTGKTYQGGNIMLLFMAAQAKGYSSNQWMGYNQGQEIGGQVREGEKSTLIIRSKPIYEKDPITKKDDPTKIKFIRTFGVRVFNADQFDGLPDHIANPEQIEPMPIPDVAVWAAEVLGANIKHGGNSACYIPSQDEIHMPEYAIFKTPEGYNGTLFHEVIHWTGAKARLDRLKAGAFGSENYAREELVAEIGAAMLCAALGHPYVVEHHASYVKSWLRAIKDDPKAVRKAAQDAAKAMQYVLDLAARGEDKLAA